MHLTSKEINASVTWLHQISRKYVATYDLKKIAIPNCVSPALIPCLQDYFKFGDIKEW